nr:uncharacterized protein LOC129388009 [Dermacentor andersoni]
MTPGTSSTFTLSTDLFFLCLSCAIRHGQQQSIKFLPLARKNPDDKDKDKRPKKKGELDEKTKKIIEKMATLTTAAMGFVIVLFVEMFIVYRLGLFVDHLPK